AEKIAIAREHLLPRQIERAGLEASDVEFSDVALSMIAAEYTREAGVRQLERGLAKVLRKVAVQLDRSALPAGAAAVPGESAAEAERAAEAENAEEAEGGGSTAVERPVHVDADALVTYLG